MFDPTNARYRYLYFKNELSNRRYVKSSIGIEGVDVISRSSSDVAHGSYGALLFRSEWLLKRSEIISRDQNRCVICEESTGLQVHHRQYHFVVSENQFKLPWEYPNHLLITLCESCHKRGHAKYKVPTINI